MKTVESIEQSIEKLGWTIERNGNWTRAAQGGFKTLFRKEIEQTLKDVQAICEARSKVTGAPF